MGLLVCFIHRHPHTRHNANKNSGEVSGSENKQFVLFITCADAATWHRKGENLHQLLQRSAKHHVGYSSMSASTENFECCKRGAD